MLNIKNQRAHDLAKEIAAADGTSLTAAVLSALEDRVERIRRLRDHGVVVVEVREITARMRARAGSRPISDHDELLYDRETGLPL